MKKTVNVLVGLLIFCLAMVLTLNVLFIAAVIPGASGAKGDKGDKGDQGNPGNAGKSAYEIWLEQGHTGSEDDFLDWLKGESGGQGKDGNTWHYGKEKPTDDVGNDGDFYYCQLEGLLKGYTIYYKANGVWTVVFETVELASSEEIEQMERVIIADAAECAALAQLVARGETFEDVEITLADDLNFNSADTVTYGAALANWTPIGDKDSGRYFMGTFDGANHTITGINIQGEDFDVTADDPDYYVALFGAVKNATIKNITVEGTVKGKNAAGIVARAEGSTVIENCTNNATVTGSVKAGGIACVATGGNVKFINCTNNANIVYEHKKNGGAGGIVGYTSGSQLIEIINCTNNGNIEVKGDPFYIGVAVGYALGANTGAIESFVNTGELINGQTPSDGRNLYAADGTTLLCGYVGVAGNWTCDKAVVEAFVAALLAGESVTLTQDINIRANGYSKTNKIYVTADDVTIDLNGHTLYCTGDTLYLYGDNITVKNGTIARQLGTSYSYGLWVYGNDALIEGITIESGINVSGSENGGLGAVIRNCDITLDCSWVYYAVCSQKGASARIEDSTITKKHVGYNENYNYYFWIESGSQLVVKNVTRTSTVEGTQDWNPAENGVAPTYED